MRFVRAVLMAVLFLLVAVVALALPLGAEQTGYAYGATGFDYGDTVHDALPSERLVVARGSQRARFIAGASSQSRLADSPVAPSGVRVASSGINAAPMSTVRTVGRGEKVTDLVNEAKGLTFTTGNEHAVVKLANGDRVLISGGPGGIELTTDVTLNRLRNHCCEACRSGDF